MGFPLSSPAKAARERTIRNTKRRKYISCRAPGQERFTRLKTLGTDYTEEAIKKRIAGKRTRTAKAPKAERLGVNLLIDIENSIKAQQSRGYEQWAKIHKLQAQKENLYADYGKLKKQVREYDVIKRNIASILQAEKQQERERETER